MSTQFPFTQIAPISVLRKRWLLHAVYIAIVIVTYLVSTIGSPITTTEIYYLILECAIQLIFGYIFTSLLMPLQLYRNKFMLYIFSGAIVIMVFSNITAKLGTYMLQEIIAPQQLTWTNSVAIYVLYFFMVTALKLGKDLLIHQHDSAQKGKQKVQQELAFLKSQLSPHFLLNTMNNIYGLAVAKSDALPEIVLKLSDLLRFTVYNSKDNLVPVQDELKYLQDYVSLQKIRLNSTSSVQLHLPEAKHHGGFVMPMVLIVFVENAFKHGTAMAQSSEVDITFNVEIHGDNLYFEARNRYDASLKTKMANEQLTSDGIGMGNTLRRVELVYGNGALPVVEEADGWYTIKIKLKLHESAELLDS
jgi:sensor histidine kinase YesM